MDGGTWIAVALAVVALLGTAWERGTNRKVAKDKLEHDAKLVDMQAQLTIAVAKSAACEQKHDETEAKLDACEKNHEHADVRIAGLERAMTVLLSDKPDKSKG